MSHNFRIEPVTGTNFIKIYPLNNDNHPIQINCNNRFVTVFPLFEEYSEAIHDFEVRSDDIWVITQPKSGTTWMLELVWLLQNDCDFETALKVEQEDRVPFFEVCTILPKERPNSIDIVANMSSPRIIKTHLSMHLLPKQLWTVKPKIIYVARDLRDAIVSYYHQVTLIGLFKGTRDEFVISMINNKQRFAPYGDHACEFWQIRKLPYVFFTSYERMKKDLRAVILKLSIFLQKDVSEEEMVLLLDHLSFGKMKENSKCNHINEFRLIRKHYCGIDETTQNKFVRKGEINSYKTELSEGTKEELERWNTKLMQIYGVTAEEMFYL